MRRGKRNKRKALLSSSDSGADRPARKVSRTGHVTLYSAWWPNIAAAPVYVRNPPMREYSFTRTTAKVGKAGGVVFSTSSEEEGIEIATDWPEGELMWKDSEPFRQTGFIGQGYTKRAIYVCVTTHSTCYVADLGLIFSAAFRAKRWHSLRSWGKGARVSC